MLLLERLHLRPRGLADFGVTLLAVWGLCALWCAVGRWFRHVVAARVHRWRTDQGATGGGHTAAVPAWPAAGQSDVAPGPAISGARVSMSM